MSDNYRDLVDIIPDPDLYLPIAGSRYRVAAPSKTRTDELRAAVASGVAGDAERDLYERLLGDTVDAMVADEVPDVYIAHAGRTAVLHFAMGPEVGAVHWQLGVLGTAYSVADLLAALRDDTPTPPVAAPD